MELLGIPDRDFGYPSYRPPFNVRIQGGGSVSSGEGVAKPDVSSTGAVAGAVAAPNDGS